MGSKTYGKTRGCDKNKKTCIYIEGIPWSLTVSVLLCPAASPPPAHGRSWLHSGEESDHPVKTTGFRLMFIFELYTITDFVLEQGTEALAARGKTPAGDQASVF